MSRIYLVVNSDLQMSPGKVGAQIGHGVQDIMEYYLKHPDQERNFRDYKIDGSTKIILKAPESKIRALHQKYPDSSFLIIDAGRTEIPSNSITVLAFLPMEEPFKELKRFKLY